MKIKIVFWYFKIKMCMGRFNLKTILEKKKSQTYFAKKTLLERESNSCLIPYFSFFC